MLSALLIARAIESGEFTPAQAVDLCAANIAELGTIAAVAVSVWHHPYLTLSLALALLVVLILVVRRIVLTLRRLLSGDWYSAGKPVKETPAPR